MANLSISNETDEDFDWEISSLGNDFTPAFYDGAGVALEEVSSGQSSAPDYVIDTASPSTGNSNTTGELNTADRMTPNSNRTVYGYAQAANGLYYPADDATANMDALVIDVDLLESRRIDLDWSGVYYADYYQIFWSTTSNPYDQTDGGSNIFTSSGYSITGLEPETTYYYIIEIKEEAGLGGDVIAQNIETFTTLEDPRPNNFEWLTIFYSGKVVPVVNKKIEIVPYYEWNTFTNRINAFRAYSGLAAYSFTQAAQGADLRAIYIDEAIHAISDMPHTGTIPYIRYAGDDIEASIFLDLRDELNSIP